MVKRSLVAAIFIATGICGSSAMAQDVDFADITGVWTGTYTTAFPSEHPVFIKETRGTTMELHVTRQDQNLFWAENRWRVDGAQDWVVESATGTFSLFDPTELTIVETGPAPKGANTGLFDGRLRDGKLYLTYKGVLDGVSFSAVLERR